MRHFSLGVGSVTDGVHVVSSVEDKEEAAASMLSSTHSSLLQPFFV